MRAPSLPRLALVLAVAFARPAFARHAPRRPRPPAIEVAPVGARAAAATEEMRARVREHVQRRLRALDPRVLTSPAGYVVDGSIDAFEVAPRDGGFEISCAVRLIVSARASGAMLAMTTGQAAWRGPRRAPEPRAEARLEGEVLDDATRAAADELVQHLEARRKS